MMDMAAKPQDVGRDFFDRARARLRLESVRGTDTPRAH